MATKMVEILIPTDFSPGSAVAVRYATAIAKHFGSRLTLLHVLPPLNIAYQPQGSPDSWGSMFEDHKKYLREKLEGFLAENLKEFEIKRVLLEGDPAQQICEYAASGKVDMIVMETRGTGIFRRFILGSVTAKVLHDAPCPVLTGVHTKETDTAQEWSIRRILCAIDPASNDGAAVQWAKWLAAAFQASLSVVHVMPFPPFHLQTYSIESELRSLLSRGERERIMKLVEVTGCPPDTEIHLLWGPVSKVVSSLAEDLQADIIVIGHGNENGGHGRLHTTGYSIIRDSICPVLSV